MLVNIIVGLSCLLTIICLGGIAYNSIRVMRLGIEGESIKKNLILALAFVGIGFSVGIFCRYTVHQKYLETRAVRQVQDSGVTK